ncbi:hypothetical protein J4226_04425 [Candidatus Pacearchaeota archaeon]|nr:hypothetical protein [Candidatus Pacearchaeota archaeon]
MKFEIFIILFLLSGFVSGLAIEENINPEKSFWEKVFSWSYWMEKIGFTGKVVEEVVSEEVVSEEGRLLVRRLLVRRLLVRRLLVRRLLVRRLLVRRLWLFLSSKFRMII